MALTKNKYVVIQDQLINGSLLQIDCTISENHQYAAQVTQFDIEDGSKIADHRIINPDVLELTGLISDYNDNKILINNNLQNSDKALAGQNSQSTKSIDAADLLKYWHTNNSVLNVQTGLQLFTDMMITGFSFPRDKSTVYSLQFTISFVKTTFAMLETQSVPPEAFKQDGTEKKAPKPKQKANKTTKEATPEKQAEVQEKSLLKYGTQEAGSIFGG